MFNGVGFGFLINIRSSLLTSLLVSLIDNTPKRRDQPLSLYVSLILIISSICSFSRARRTIMKSS